MSDTAVHKAIKAGHIHANALKVVKGRTKGIDPDIADSQWSSTISENKSRKSDVSERFKKTRSAPASDLREDMRPQDSLSTAKAQQVEAVYKAKLRKLEFETKSGSLVDKSQVYRALFAAGQEIRSAFEGIADRYIDEILAAPTRNDAHTVLQSAIDEALKSVSDLKDRKISRDV